MHHANLYISRNALPDLSHIDKVDLVELVESKLSIGSVRKLIDQAYTQPLTPAGERAIVVVSDQINIEAQNALLKVLEEPPSHTNFYFVISDHTRLLPTLRSRFQIFAESDIQNLEIVKEFIQLPIAQRLTLVTEKTAAKDTLWQQSILSGIERLCLEKKLSKQVATEVLFVKKYISGSGASPKMLLEHLALTI